MKNLRFARKWILIALFGTALAMGLATLMQGEAQATDCGPTLNWNCVRPRCPESRVLVHRDGLRKEPVRAADPHSLLPGVIDPSAQRPAEEPRRAADLSILPI